MKDRRKEEEKKRFVAVRFQVQGKGNKKG